MMKEIKEVLRMAIIEENTKEEIESLKLVASGIAFMMCVPLIICMVL